MSKEFKTDAERQRGRFWQRFYIGIELADRFRYLTLNSSDESVVMGLDVLDSLSKLVKRIRRKYGVFEYFGVKERDTEVELREHLHLVCKGVYMPQRELEDMWVGVHRSIKPFIKVVSNAGGAARYLGKYIGSQGSGRYLMSAGWIFSGFVGWSKKYNRLIGHYPDVEAVRYMVELSEVERSKYME